MPLKMFISHKIGEQAEIVRSFVKILNRFSGPQDLIIFDSTKITPGENFRQRIIEELNNTEIFLLMCNYTNPPEINDWCIFEMGYFSSIADQDQKKLISIVKQGGIPPDPVKDLQCIEETREDIETLLREIYLNHNPPLRADLFDVANQKLLQETITEILLVLKPKSKTIILTPRVWITIKHDKFDDFKNGKITLPLDSTIHGETEVFLGSTFNSLSTEEDLTLKRFDEIVEYPPSIKPFFILLGEILHKIVNAPQRGPWRIPPVRIFNNKNPRIIVPASLKKCAQGNYCFEFYVTEPPPYTENVTTPEYSALFNLFVISWSFRWQVIESHINQLKRHKNVYSRDPDEENRKKNRLKAELRELYLDLNRITLDSSNRKIQNEVDVTDMFEGEEREIMKNIVDPRDGLWGKIIPSFYKSYETELEKLNGEHVDEIISYLHAWQDINKTSLILVLNRLLALTKDGSTISGALITQHTTIEEILERS